MQDRLSKNGYLSLLAPATLLRFVAMAALCAPALPADTMQVFSRAALGGSDSIDWSQLGTFVPQPIIPNLPNNPVSVVSSDGMSVLASSPGGYLFQDQQASSTVTCQCWNGNFGPGDYLLGADSLNPTSLTLTFSTPVYGVGTQIAEGLSAGPFTGMMQLFDPLGNSLGSYTVAGNQVDTADNTAVFIGALSSIPIGSVTFSTSAIDESVINQVDLVTTPEPGSWLLCLTGIALLCRKLARAS